MLIMNQLSGFGAGGGVSLAVDLTAQEGDGSSGSSFTFTDVDIGGPGLIAVNIHTEAAFSHVIDSVTIGGNTATINKQITAGSGNKALSAVASYRIASGTTATIVVNASSSCYRCQIAVHRIQNNESDTPIETQFDSDGAGTGLSMGFTAMQPKAFVICAQTHQLHDVSATWTNADEEYDLNIEAGNTRALGAILLNSDGSNVTISTTNANAGGQTLVGVAWR